MQIVKSESNFAVVKGNQAIARLEVNSSLVKFNWLRLEHLDKILLLLIKRFRNKMYESLTLEITSDNNELEQFLRVFLQKENIAVTKNNNTLTLKVFLISLQNKSVKVIPIWLGERRKWQSDFVKEAEALVKVIIDKEINLDKGVPCDTFIVINRPYDDWAIDRTTDIKNSILSLDGRETKNGVFKVIERENSGISYGAFSHVFDLHKDDYDFWFFNEDDYIIDAENYMLNDYHQFREIDNNAGYISESGVCDNFPLTEYPTHVHFGLGLTSREILSQVGKLPYMVSNTDSADMHHLYGEIPFTNEIYKLGYDLIISRNFDCMKDWMSKDFNSFR
ncbi:MAG TPA: hypothetical protein VGO56_05560 [Pyrinomonadaceae bacterium]|nr:hypothetical protein [Pyrinomonadaceae bacterium]